MRPVSLSLSLSEVLALPYLHLWVGPLISPESTSLAGDCNAHLARLGYRYSWSQGTARSSGTWDLQGAGVLRLGGRGGMAQ